MATRKNASKTSKRASIDLNLDDKTSKKTHRSAKKQLKKLSVKTIFISLVLCLLFAAAGFFGFKFITRNDCFEIVGGDEVSAILSEGYEDKGVKVVSFGKDANDKVEIETNLTLKDGKYYADGEGTYYIIYKVKDMKYGGIFKVQKIRLITFLEASEGGNYEE